MARGRMIDKRVSNSKKLGKISNKSRVLWFMIYPHLDREARIAFDDLEDLQDEIIPKFKDWTLKKISESLNELADIELIDLYPNKNKIAMEFRKFEDFQTGLRKDREAPSKIDPPGATPESSGVFRITPALRLRLSIKEVLRKEDIMFGKPNAPSPKKTPTEYKFEESHKNLAKLLESKIQARLPKHRFQGKDYLDRWANDFRIMEEKKEATPEEIEKTIIWALKHDFWYRNILSAGKLRKQFGRLWAEMQEDKEGKPISRQPTKKEQYLKEQRRKFLERDKNDKQA